MKGLFIPEITAEMFRNGCLESIEALMAEGEIYDIDYQEPCEDCISRQAVLEVLKKNRYRFNISQEGNCEGTVLWSEKLIKDDAYKEIEQLSSATPKKKTGWHIAHGMYEDRFWCSCGYIKVMDSSMTEWKYCPVCGEARMVETTGKER